jgi:hypothetical protein
MARAGPHWRPGSKPPVITQARRVQVMTDPEYMGTTAEPPAVDVYALGRDPVESARLRRQSQELRSDSAALLDRVGLGPGQSVGRADDIDIELP